MNKEQMEEDIREAVKVLRAGGLILYPTDTVWGIGCDATNAEAVAKVYALKKRAESKSMLVLVDSADRASLYASGMTDTAYDMLTMSDKPLTLILDGAKNLAKNLIAEDGSIGIRVTTEEYSKELCFRFGKAIVSTSANVSGEPAAGVYSEISEEIRSGVDYIAKCRRDETKKSQPSSIVRLREDGRVTVIRP